MSAGFGRMLMCWGTAIVTYVLIVPGDQIWQALVGGGLIGLGSLADD